MPEARNPARAPDALLTISEVAGRLNVSTKTARRWVERGDLVAHRLGRAIRISEVDLRAFLALRRAP